MTCLEMCILTLVIGFTTILVGCSIIQKIYDENRKNADKATEKLNDFMAKSVNAILQAYNEISKKEEEKRRKEQAEREERYKKYDE